MGIQQPQFLIAKGTNEQGRKTVTGEKSLNVGGNQNISLLKRLNIGGNPNITNAHIK